MDLSKHVQPCGLFETKAEPPDDPEVKNIIDKLANFVARNGPEFEEMTKQKQQDNAKFAFLYGGEHYAYYQFKVHSERNFSNPQSTKLQEQQHQTISVVQQQIGQQHVVSQSGLAPTSQPPQLSQPAPMPVVQTMPPAPWVTPAVQPLTAQVLPASTMVSVAPEAAAQQQINQLQQQITVQQTQIQQQQVIMEQQVKQSEQNLAAQYQSLIQQQQVQIEEAIFATQSEELKKLSEECHIQLDELDRTVQPIIESCTKDAILNGKSWIFNNCTTDQQTILVAEYLLKRILSKDAGFELRLHLIYLINDLLHHCQRKNAGNLKAELARIVVAVFCTSLVGAGDDKKIKLNKLLTLWEQNKYFDLVTIQKMKEPDQALSGYHADLITESGPIVSRITSGVQAQYASLMTQHTEFTSHLVTQLQLLQTQLAQLQTQLAQAQAALITAQVMPALSTPAPISSVMALVPPSVSLPSLTAAPTSVPGIPTTATGPSIVTSQSARVTTNAGSQPNFNHPPLRFQQQPPSSYGRPPPIPPPGPFDFPRGAQGAAPWAPQGPPPGPGNFPMPDFSKPPPGFPPRGPPFIPPPDIDLTPAVPYYELPAGLMAPLIKLEDHDYRPLDPKDIRLPPPMPPSERLLAAVEMFFSPPFHDRPRDSEGWEKLGLYEFFKAKQKAKKMRDRRQLSRSRSRSMSPVQRQSPVPEPEPSPVKKRRYNSRSRSRSRSASSSSSRSRSRSRSPTASDSRSPLPYKRSSRSPTMSRSPERRPRSRSPERRPRSRSRTRSRSRSRSATPPMFSTEDFLAKAAAASTTERLGEENRGHMLLRKMGWGGKGLGAKEQGIVDPISGADARDKQDQFKGVGSDMTDPFEQFRKNKSQGFITLMKSRNDTKEVKKKREDD